MNAIRGKQVCHSLTCEVMTGGSLLLARRFESQGEVNRNFGVPAKTEHSKLNPTKNGHKCYVLVQPTKAQFPPSHANVADNSCSVNATRASLVNPSTFRDNYRHQKESSLAAVKVNIYRFLEIQPKKTEL